MEVTYKLFGLIPLWSVKRDVSNDDALYKEMSERFQQELQDEVKRQRGVK